MYLRRLFWARPLHAARPPPQAPSGSPATTRTGCCSTRRSRARDGFFTTFFVSPYSKYIARWAARRGLTPNQVTTVSMLIGVLAAAGFATGERWGLVAGAVLLQIAFTTDCVDGQLARYTRQFSKFGAWLDSVFDRAKEYLAFAGLAIGASRAGDPVWLLACCAITLQTVRHMSDFAYGGTQQQVDRDRAAAAARAGARQRERRRGAARGRAAGRRQRPASARSPRACSAPGSALDRVRAVRWLKRMITFPIGERFAVISITAALFTPRVTFVALLAWGGVGVRVHPDRPQCCERLR